MIYDETSIVGQILNEWSRKAVSGQRSNGMPTSVWLVVQARIVAFSEIFYRAQPQALRRRQALGCR